MLERNLEKIGLQPKEAKVYLAMLELGQATVQQIAAKADVVRPTTYVIIKKLLALGIASSIEVKGKTLLIAEDPHELTAVLEEQEHQLTTKRSELDGVMSQLMAIYNRKQGKPVVRYFEGEDGLQALERAARSRIEPNATVYYVMPIDLVENRFRRQRSTSVEERVSQGIRAKTIYTHADGPIPEEIHLKNLREAVFIPRSDFPLDATISIYPKLFVKLFYFGSNPHGILIESPELARNFELLFNLAWEGAKLKEKEKEASVTPPGR